MKLCLVFCILCILGLTGCSKVDKDEVIDAEQNTIVANSQEQESIAEAITLGNEASDEKVSEDINSSIPDIMQIDGEIYWETNKEYLGFKWNPELYSRDEAINKGYIIVSPLSGTGIEYGQEILDDFISQCERNIPGIIHLVEEHFNSDNEINVKFYDVIYDGSFYYGIRYGKESDIKNIIISKFFEVSLMQLGWVQNMDV